MSSRQIVMLVAITTMAMPVAWAADRDPAQQLALQFKRLCLGRLTHAEVSQRDNRMRLTPTRVRTLGETLVTFWRASKPADDLLYSFDISSLPKQRIRIVGCSVGGHDIAVEGVIAALEQPSSLGKSNDSTAPSLISRKAGWFFVRHNEPDWVSVSDIRVGDEQMVIVAISTHQRLRP